MSAQFPKLSRTPGGAEKLTDGGVELLSEELLHGRHFDGYVVGVNDVGWFCGRAAEWSCRCR
jgi:hypothetical protein